ncbi:RNA polymerase sigma factor [Streptacidiphilus melanogenes]|uniref:RNA polymerase sigma factor n=1 Tax=Streptacidiphilus melanogenes TaxID=411235 RepID=UPI0006945184|nr:hypothetical protein [Streptacidiphilus melanogenes]
MGETATPAHPAQATTAAARTRSADRDKAARSTAGGNPAQPDTAQPDPAQPDAARPRCTEPDAASAAGIGDAPSLSSLAPAPISPGRHGALGSGHAAVAGTRSVEAEAVGHAAGREPSNSTPAASASAGAFPHVAPPAPVASAALPATREAFDALYASLAPELTWQTFLLTVNRHRAAHCVRRAFQLAWTNWTTVSADPSPEGWLRAAAFDLALSPWHGGGPRMQHAFRLPRLRAQRTATVDVDDAVGHTPDATPGAQDRALLRTLMRLPRPQRRALVLHDVIGLDWAQTAAEVEGSTPVTFGRVARARRTMAEALPEIAGPDPEAAGFGRRLGDRLRAAAVRAFASTPEQIPAHVTRTRARLHDGGLTLAAGALALATAAFLGAGAVLGTPMHPAERPVVPHPTRATIMGTANDAPTADFQPPKVPAPPITAFTTGPGLVQQSQDTSGDAKKRSHKGRRHPGRRGAPGKPAGQAKPGGPGHPGAAGGHPQGHPHQPHPRNVTALD